MKAKLYRKFVKLVCADFKITREQLFSRHYGPCVMQPHKYDLHTHSLVVDTSWMMVLTYQHPLSQVWECYDFHTRWLAKYWKYSHWKPYIQMKLDLGFRLEDVLQEIVSKHKSE